MLYTSERTVAACPAITSGAMYIGVPASAALVCSAAAMRSSPAPRSMTTIRPPTSRITFCALMSRWSSPALCTAATDRHTSMPMSVASCAPKGPWSRRMRASVRPWMNSIHSPTRPSKRSTPYTDTKFGWRTRASDRPSWIASASSCSSFSATSRSRLSSHARNTSPNDPRPSGSRIRSRPQREGCCGAGSAGSAAPAEPCSTATSCRTRRFLIADLRPSFPADDSSAAQSIERPSRMSAASDSRRSRSGS